MIEITKDLYQFSLYIPPIDFTIHQYLLASDPAILFAAGTCQQAASIIPGLRRILHGRPLSYVFVSHMESDEAGGLFLLHKEFPDLKVIAAPLTARELPGFGYTGEIIVKKGGESLAEGNLSLEFLDYPSEVHLQNGLLPFEKKRGILYSADLFLRFGNGRGKVMDCDWEKEVDTIPEERVPAEKMRTSLQDRLKCISPTFIAVGHGTCMKMEK